MKKYIKPETEILKSEIQMMLAASVNVNDDTYADGTKPIYVPINGDHITDDSEE